MNLEKIRSNMVKGQPVRLFPVLPDSRKEEKATSILLAIFATVPDFAREVLSDAGVSIGKKSKIHCFTEVSFKGSELRPDGLVIVEKPSDTWAALVETKVGRNDLTPEQIETYLDIARVQGFDAVITISNQFAALPTHHPVTVSKAKTRQVGLYHFSWMSIVSRALLLIDTDTIIDAEQTYLLKELIRYLEHDSSGAASAISMSASWRQICQDIHQNVVLNKRNPVVAKAVGDWFQLLRYLSIRLSVALGQPCHVWMSNKYKQSPELRLEESINEMVERNEFAAEIDIPNAAGKVSVVISLARKTIDLAVNIQTPKDRKQPLSAIYFVLAQMKEHEGEDLTIKVNWPRRGSTALPLIKALDEETRKELVPPNFKDLPSSVDILRVIDLGVGKIKSPSGLPNIAQSALIDFYQDVVQGLKQWVPKAPKVRTEREPEESNLKESSENGSDILDVVTANSEPLLFRRFLFPNK